MFGRDFAVMVALLRWPSWSCGGAQIAIAGRQRAVAMMTPVRCRRVDLIAPRACARPWRALAGGPITVYRRGHGITILINSASCLAAGG
jgi:hypothetical protein